MRAFSSKIPGGEGTSEARFNELVPEPTDELKARARDLGFEEVGVCAPVPSPHLAEYRAWLGKGYHGTMDYLSRQLDLKSSPRKLLPSVRSVVAVTLNYNQPNPPRPGCPRIARYALGRDYHKVLRGKLRRLASWLVSAYPEAECRACVDSAPIFERDYAHLAGLGWFGKNTMLIDSKRGSWFFIGLLLTSVEFELDSPSEGSCGKCRKCIDACPTGAIVFEENRWQVDARSCISYLTIEHKGSIEPNLSTGIGEWTFGCDVCQEVCPFNEPRTSQPLRGSMTSETNFATKRNWPTLKQLERLQSPEWDNLTRGSPVRRTGLEGLKRNAKLNLRAEKGTR